MKKFSKETSEILSLCNKTKLIILDSIFKCSGNTCNCDLVEKLDIPKNLVSYHIKTLIDADVIEVIRCGKSKKYQIKNKHLQKIKDLLSALKII